MTAEDSPVKEKTDEKASQLPEPSGYRILLSLPDVDKKTQGGIYKPESIIDTESMATVVAFVTKMGPDCYQDKERFPSGSYCKEGDFVLIRAFQGTRFKIHGVEFRIINDDNVEAVVDDPRGYTRV